MTAGMVSVPTIVPLKAPGTGRKWEIDTRTAIEISSNTAETTIFYTVDGSKPDPFKKLGQTSTFKYTKPIFLGKGKITLKAMAVLKDGSKESSVNTKTFQINEAKYEIVDEENDDEEDNVSIDEDDDEELEFRRKAKSDYVSQKRNPSYQEDNSLYKTDFYKSTYKSPAWENGNRNFTKNYSRNESEFSKSRLLEQICSTRNDDLWGTKSREFSKKEDSGVRKVLNGLELKNMQITDLTGVNQDINYEMLGTGGIYPRTAMPPKSGVTAKYIKEENDLRRCVYCHAVRPADPYARFCNECAAALPPAPGTRSQPLGEETNQTCPFCFANVPSNSLSCLVCEKVLHGRTDDVSQSYIEKVVCLQCGTSSPSGSKRCVVCESVLPVQKVFTQHVVNKPPQPNRETFLQCSKCGRVNSCDARFCDWCGSKPLPSSSVVTCITCRTNNQPYAKYCASCGHNITPPVRPDYSSLYPNQKSIPATSNVMSYHREDAKWFSLTAPLPRTDKKTYGTQTVENFTNSSKLIDAQCKIDEDKHRIKRPLSAMSPGKGYWRQQIDYVSQHLKIYTQNNIEFRDSISHMKIGKLLGAIAQEELDGQELSITLSFSLRNKDGHTLNATAKTIQHGTAFINALKNSKNAKESKGNPEGKKKKLKKKVKKKVLSKDAKLSSETLRLLKTLADTSEVEVDTLNELVDSGCDVNAINSEGMTPLKLAVTSKHINCIQAVVDAGADVDLKSGPKGNTALHEAVRLGMDGVDAVEKLLDAGADQDIANDNGQTPYDMAVKSGMDNLISKFTAKLGQDLLSETIN